MCSIVKAQRKAERTRKFEEWKERDAAYQGLQASKQLLPEQQKLRSRADDASSDAASTCAETVDHDERQAKRCEEMLRDARGGRLALSPQEEREARKIQKKLRDIARLQGQLDQGLTLDKLQLDKVQSKNVLESHLVMQKIRAGAHRPSL